MTSLDVHIGFAKAPEGLDEFLAERGFRRKKAGKGAVSYSHRKTDYPHLFYHARVARRDDGERPDWSGSGIDVMAELHIRVRDERQFDSLNELSRDVVLRYDAISWERDLGFFQSQDYR